MSQHRAIVFDCAGAKLVGVAEIPSEPRRTGLLVVTGGPQYRVGSHRQFPILCRTLASDRFASFRFDYRGSGDSDGDPVSFVDVQPDIAAAIDQLIKLAPEISQVVLLGLCDGASAALLYAPGDSRVTGVVMLNPWVRTAGSMEGRALISGVWKRLMTGKVNVRKSIKSFREQPAVADVGNESITVTDNPVITPDNFLAAMLVAARRFAGEMLVVLSGQDMTAQEYRDLIAESDDWRDRMSAGNVKHREISEANHTFASAAWRSAVAGHCQAFLQSLDARLDVPADD